MAVQYAFGQIVTNGLVLALDAADRNSYVSGSTTWGDMSGNGNNGSLVSGPTFSNNSIVFDGVNDGVNITNNFSGSIENNITVEAFIQLNTSQNTRIFVSNYTQVVSPTGFAIGISDSTNNVVKWFTGNLGTTNTLFSTTTLINQLHYHVVGTYNGNNKILYINGVSEASATLTNAINNTSAVASIGYLRSVNTQYLNGSIPIARVYNRALSASEILQNYNAQKLRFGLK